MITSKVESREETFNGADGTLLFARSWPHEGKGRGLVVIAHGFLAHTGLYAWVGSELARAGFSVYAADLRGHGQSAGNRFWVERFSDYVSDFGRLVELAMSRQPEMPTFVLGHSAGAVIASLHVLEHQKELAGLISESIAFELPAPDIVLALMKGLDHVLPHASVLGLKPEDFSRDPPFVERVHGDPLITHTAGPMHTLAEMARANVLLEAGFASIALPILILHGTADKAAKAHGSQRFFDEVGSTDKTLKLYEGYRHDLLNDIGKEDVLAGIVAWLGARVDK